MGKIIFRLLFKFARKLALKKLESMLVDYAKDKLEGLLDAPKTPDFGEVPLLPTVGSRAKDGETVEASDESENIKAAVATKVGGLIVGLASLSGRSSEIETRDAMRDLDRVTEDWDIDLLPVALTVGREITNRVDSLVKSGDELSFAKLEYTMPTLPKFEPLEPFECRISDKLYSGSTDEKATDGTATTANTGGVNTRTAATYTNAKKTRRSATEAVPAVERIAASRESGHYDFGKSRAYGERTAIAREGDILDGLFEYTRSADRKIRGGVYLKKIDEIIIHCTADHEGVERTVASIDRDHRVNRGWVGIGYHYLIHLDGTIESARSIRYEGAHCKEGGHNHHSIGIAYVGGVEKYSNKAKDTRTAAQKRQIWNLVLYLQKVIPTITEVHGHREFCNKECPSFDVKKEWAELKSGKSFNGEYLASRSEETVTVAAATPQGGTAQSGYTKYTKSTSQHFDDIYLQKRERKVVNINDV